MRYPDGGGLTAEDRAAGRRCGWQPRINRGGGRRPGSREAVPGEPGVGEPVAGAGRGRPGSAGVEGRGRGPMQADCGSAGGAGGGAGCGPGRVGLG
jgi:hypothetical protein